MDAPVTVGNVIATAARLAGRTAPRAIAAAAVVAAPLAAVAAQGVRAPTVPLDVVAAAGALVAADAAVGAIVTHAALAAVRGEPAGVGAALRRLPAVLGVVVFACFVTGALGVAMMLPLAGAADAVVVVGAVMLALWTAFTIALYTRWLVAVPVAIAERPGVGASLDRSGVLTQGYRLRLGALLVVGVAAIAAAGAALHVVVPARHLVVAGAVAWPVVSVARALIAAAAYHLITGERAARSPEHLARVFD